ncbi:MAG: ribonuclease H-like domain-containing protein, partial [Nitrospirota bacterium]
FRYSVQDASGAKSIYWYSEFLKDPIANRKYMDMIVKYNREDCEATMLVKDWLTGEFEAMG